MNKGTYVYCQTRFIGFHRWPDAPDEVKYLRARHRHEFHVKVTVSVKHNNRSVEFITLRKDVDELIKESIPDWIETISCEMMAESIIEDLDDLGYIVDSVEVSEDGENGAIVVCQ